MTARAAIYARFSTDMQRDASIDDQVRVCTAHLRHEGASVVKTYVDYAISGATALRPGYQALMGDARAGGFDLVVAESLDRFSRDQEHIAAFFKLMSFAGIAIVTLAEGVITELHIGLKGTMSALFLKDLAKKTHRGLEGRVRAGRSAGGLSYGYRVVRELAADGTPSTGQRAIEESEAKVVRSIFNDYLGGLSPRTIARTLNAANVPGPRGGRWTASLLLGNALREIGVLRNRLYIGELVWNRQHFIKDPATGKRIARANPRVAWIVEPVPALRIIDPTLWNAVQQRLEVRRDVVTTVRHGGSDKTAEPDVGSTRGGRLAAVRRPPWLLSGLVRCGSCGGIMTVVAQGGRLGCANRRERGTCTNGRTVLRDRVVSRVLAGLKDRLLAPQLVEIFISEYIAEINRANHDAVSKGSHLKTELARVGRQIRTMVQTITDTGGSRSLVQELRNLEQRQIELTEEMAATCRPEALPALHPNLAQVYRQKVSDLENALDDPRISAAAVEALRSLIDVIAVYPGDKRGEVHLELRGDLAAFVRLSSGAQFGTLADAAVQISNRGARRFGSTEVMGSLGLRG
jgi:site-specific DNA recombinase